MLPELDLVYTRNLVIDNIFIVSADDESNVYLVRVYDIDGDWSYLFFKITSKHVYLLRRANISSSNKLVDVEREEGFGSLYSGRFGFFISYRLPEMVDSNIDLANYFFMLKNEIDNKLKDLSLRGSD